MKLFPNKFPSISRTITENKVIQPVAKKWFKFIGHSKTKTTFSYFSVILTLILIVILTGFTIYLGVRFSQNLQNFINVASQKDQIEGKINFWSSIAQKYDGYPDAYFNMAALYFQISDFKNARIYLDRTLLLNPDNIQAGVLDKKLRLSGY